MREYQRARRARLKEEKGKPLQPLQNIVKKDVKVNNKMLELSLEGLRPPAEPIISSDMDLDFNAIARSSDFQRFIIYLAKKITPGIFKGVNTRKSNIVMVEQFNQKRADYREVMKELKLKIEEKR